MKPYSLDLRQKLVDAYRNPHGQMITLIGAITVEQVMTTMTVNGGTDGSVFRTFITQMLVPHLWSGACVVADNLSAHKVAGISSEG